jgi:hypothetical protein
MKKYRILTMQADPEISLRIPKEICDSLEKLANEKGRSLNTQLVISLIDSLESLEKAKQAATINRQYSGEELMRIIMNEKAVDFKPLKQKQ